MPIEERLCCLTAWCKDESGYTGKLRRAFAQVRNWQQSIMRLKSERLACLAYQRWKHAGVLADMPLEAAGMLENNYYEDTIRAMLLCREYARIGKELNIRHIPYIHLKGVFLAQFVYSSIALRPFTDFDFLIKKSDLTAVHEILIGLGYTPPPYLADAVRAGVSSINSLVYTKNGPIACIAHVHWHCMNSTWPLEAVVRRMDIEKIWAVSTIAEREGVAGGVLAAHHTLVYLAQHACGHNFDKISMLVDIAQAIQAYGDALDWDAAIAHACQTGLVPVLYCALYYVEIYCGVSVPCMEEIHQKIPALYRGIITACLKRTMRSYGCAYGISFLSQQGMREKAEFLYKSIVPPPFVMAQSFGIAQAEVRAVHYWRRIQRML